MQKLFFFGTTFSYRILVCDASFIQTARVTFSAELWMWRHRAYIFTVPQIWAYFLDNLEIDSFKIAVSEHILLYFKNSKSFFLCTHESIMCGTRCVKLSCHDSWCILSFSTGKQSTYFHRICVFIHILR